MSKNNKSRRTKENSKKTKKSKNDAIRNKNKISKNCLKENSRIKQLENSRNARRIKKQCSSIVENGESSKRIFQEINNNNKNVIINILNINLNFLEEDRSMIENSPDLYKELRINTAIMMVRLCIKLFPDTRPIFVKMIKDHQKKISAESNMTSK